MFERALVASGDVVAVSTQGAGLSISDMVVRAMIVMLARLIIVRAGDRRLIGTGTPFDLVVAFMLGSALSRAITGQAPVWPTIAASAALVAAHRIVALLSLRSARLNMLLKGRPIPLVERGRLCRKEMNGSHIAEGDLVEAFRLRGELRDPSSVLSAHLECNGKISVVPMDDARADGPAERQRAAGPGPGSGYDPPSTRA